MRVWSVNTNRKDLDGLGAKIVLSQDRVVTWYLNDLDNIKIGDLVLSFNNKKRVIAVGFAISDVMGYSFNKSSLGKTDERWINIDWIWKDTKLNNPIMLKSIGITWSLRRTVEELTKDIDLKSLLIEIGKRKGD